MSLDLDYGVGSVLRTDSLPPVVFHVKQCSTEKCPQTSNSGVRPDSLPLISAHIVQQLIFYTRSLRKWRGVKSLISHSDIPLIWPRHITDSLQLVSILPRARRWLDIGSGAGFPSIVIASYFHKANDAEIHCVESDRKKCAFLAVVAREAQLHLKVHSCRISEIGPRDLPVFDAITARAFADIHEIVTVAKPYLDAGATGLFFVGQSHQLIPQYLLRDYECQLVSNVMSLSSLILVIKMRKSS
jgi:16S rRNA (guanine527-N7)-methyltransferase